MKTLSRELISEAERIKGSLYKRIGTTFAKRNQSPKDRKEWSDAADAWHSHIHPIDKLWQTHFMADLRDSVPYAVEEAILYLEVDPWYHRSGYLKERLIRGLKAATLKNSERTRLLNVCWNAAAGKNRREFRNYCSLASVVGGSDLIELLESVSEDRDREAKGKFSFMLNYLRHKTRKAIKAEKAKQRNLSD